MRIPHDPREFEIAKLGDDPSEYQNRFAFQECADQDRGIAIGVDQVFKRHIRSRIP